MPEIGIPQSAALQQYMQVEMKKNPSDSKIDQEILEKAGGRKTESLKPGKDPKSMDQTDFLKMLSHQMQNQDPMNPQDSSKYTTDLATFAQLEQLTNMNKKMDAQKNQALMEQKMIASSFVGKSVATTGNSIVTNKDGQRTQVLFNLDAPAKNVKVQLLDAKGNITAEIPMENVASGAQQVTWNGKATDGYDAPKGQYQVSVRAWDENQKSVNVSTKVTGVVDTVSFEDGEVIMMVNGKKVFLRDVDSFHRSELALPEMTNAKSENKKVFVNPDLEKVKHYQDLLVKQGVIKQP
jgi:flagellar basal-body rod modification protein FlgD